MGMSNAMSTARKGLLVAEFFDIGVAMMEQKIRNKYGNSNPTEQRRELREWLYRAHDDVPGDVSGPVRIRYRAP